MSNILSHRGLKGRPVFYIASFIALFCLVYLYQNNQETFKSLKRSEQRCIVEQEFLSSRLQVVIDYKNRMEKSLATERSEHSKAVSAARIQHQEERDALQQHFSLLQSQFDDLTLECNKLREISKTEYETKKLLTKITNLEEENAYLRRQVESLSKEKPPQFVQTHFLQADAHNKSKFIRKQEKISNDIYYVGSALNTTKKLHQKVWKVTSESSIDLKEPKLIMPQLVNISSTKSSASVSPKMKGNLPQGLAPELIVDDHLSDGEYRAVKNNGESANDLQPPPEKKHKSIDNFYNLLPLSDELDPKRNNANEVNAVDGELAPNIAEDIDKNIDQVDNPGHDANLSPDHGEAALNNPEEEGDDVDYYDAHGAVNRN